MGCWNATCHLSNLPINCGENVVVIPVMETFTYESTKGYYNYYPNSVFEPLTPAILGGKYNDYGSIEGTDLDIKNAVILECIKSLSFVQEVEDEDCDDVDETGFPIRKTIEKSITFDSIEDFINKVERSTVHNNYIYVLKNRKKHRVDFVMYIEDIYTKMMNVWKSHVDYDETVNEIVKFYNTESEYEFFKDYPDSSVWHVKSLLRVYTNPTDVEAFAKGLVEANMIASILGALRKGFMCMTGRGSQSDNYEFNFFLNELIRKHIISKVKDRIDGYCEDDAFIEKYNLDPDGAEAWDCTEEMVIDYMQNHVTDIW